MTIWVRNRKGKWVRSLDNFSWILRLHIWLANQRWWQLLITPKHVLLGVWFGYTTRDIWRFVSRHIKENLRRRKH